MTGRFHMWTVGAAAALSLALSGDLSAESAPYAGQQERNIASLSASDIAALTAGDGWGLAKPAELNGYPGPLHILELADALDLTADQRADVTAVYERMRGAAQEAGAAYIEAESHLSRMFRSGHANPARLEAMLNESAEALARLRAVHLAAHIEVTPILSDAQKTTYAELRGYAGGHSGDHSGHGKH